jgi:tetratricopeptide (TPR) repeat protein
VETGPDDAVALATAGIGLAFVANEVEEGAELIDRALALNPNLAAAWLFSGWVNGWLGNAETALDHLTRAMRLSPQDPQMAMMQAATGYAHFVAGSYDEAARWAERSTRNRPSYQIATCILAASLALSDQTEEAAQAVRRLRAIDPTLRLSNLLESYPIRRAEDSLRWTEGMRRAGLPE